MIKKTLYTLLLTVLIIPVIGIFSNEMVFAESEYRVCNVLDSGELELVDSFDTYADAYNLMRQEEDYVITHDTSLSPYKIIAMNKGIVLSYPYRKGTNTMSIFEGLDDRCNGDSNKASTYVQAYVEMMYHSTTHFFNAGEHNMNYDHGYVYVTINGFDGYCDLEAVDLIPMKIVENENVFEIGGNATGKYERYESFNVIPKQHYYYISEDGAYIDLCLKEYDHQEVTNNNPASYAIRYGVAPSFMEKNVRYYSSDGINFYTSRDLSDESYVGTYYNYYQFLPLRTYSNIKASTINQYISERTNNTGVMLNTGDDFINNQNIYGVNGVSIAAMGIHESGFGKSEISNGKFNLFGWGAYDANTKLAVEYNNVSECIAAQMGDNLSNYLDVNCNNYYTMSLGNKGGGFITKYASDPYWAEEISQYYYELDKRDNNKNGNLTDYNTYNLALVNVASDVKAQSNSNSATLFKTNHKTGYQKNMIVTVLGTENGFAKIQTSNPINNGEVIYPYSLPKGTKVEYNKDYSVGFISLNNITYLNGNKNSNVNEDDISLFSSIRELSINDDGLYINGIGALSGLNFTSKIGVKHELIFVNYADNSETSYLLNTIDSNGFSLNDSKDYTYVGFNKTIPLSELPQGSCGIKLKVTNGDYSKDQYLLCAIKQYNSQAFNSNGLSYYLSFNQLYSYRMELEVKSTPVDYSSIRKASMRKSLLTLDDDTISLDAEGNFTIGGHGFMYYLDYGNDNNVNYLIRLVNSNENYLDMATETINCSDYGYATLLGLENNLDNIKFKGSANLKDLAEGKYYLIVENSVTNTSVYHDIMELTNAIKAELPDAITINGRKITLTTDAVRSRLVINVELIEG